VPRRISAEQSIFASVDTPADAARAWLGAQFDEQARAGTDNALDDRQRAVLTQLLSTTWWRAAFEDDDQDDPAALLRDSLPPAVRAMGRDPRGGVVLALYLRNLVNEAWAMAWDHELLVCAIDAACGAVSDGDDPLAAAAWRLLGFLRTEFRVETALLTGRLAPVVAIAQEAAAQAESIVAEIARLPGADARDALLHEARNEAVYYTAVRDAGMLAARLLQGDRADPGEEIARIQAAVDGAPLNRMDASELRGHLAAVRSIAGARERDWLHVDAGRVQIVYPFGIRTMGRRGPIDVVEELYEAARRRHARGAALGGLPIRDVRNRLDLSDVWQGSDSFGRGYRGATVQLDDIVLESAAGSPLEVVGARVQLSQLGNHTIVFEIALADIPAYRVAEAVALATPVFGDVREVSDHMRMRVGVATTVSGLPDVVASVLDGIRELLDEIDGALDGSSVAAREGSFGVITTILSASRVGPASRRPLHSAAELQDLWGLQPLVHPLPSGAAGIADWAMYDLDAVQTWNLLHVNSELLASNSNVSLLASFGSPEYAVAEVESYVAFAHSLHGMYQGWQDAVRGHAETIARLLREADLTLAKADDLDRSGVHALAARRGVLIADLDDLVRRIERAELALQSFVQSNEAIILFIESPAIVTSPPLRVDLDTVLESNGYGRLRDGYVRAVREVLGSRLQPLLEVVHRRMQQAYSAERAELDRERAQRDAAAAEVRVERERRNARILELVGIVFSIVGLSGLASVLQAGHAEWDGAVAWLLVAVILAIAVGGGLLLVGWAGRPPRAARRPKEDG